MTVTLELGKTLDRDLHGSYPEAFLMGGPNVEILVRWPCPCARLSERCSKCEGNGYLERWIPQEMVRSVLGDSSFIIIDRTRTQKKRPRLPGPATKQQRQTHIGTTLFVDGLPASCTTELLSGLFATFGRVLWSRIISDANGQCSGFGYVEMETSDVAQRAAKVLDGHKVGDSSIAVMISNRTPHALQAERFLQLNSGKAFCELCLRSHITGSGASSSEVLDAFIYMYECYHLTGRCSECGKTAQVFAARNNHPKTLIVQTNEPSSASRALQSSLKVNNSENVWKVGSTAEG